MEWGDSDISLLDNKDLSSQVPGLLLLAFWKIFNARAEQELVCEIVEIVDRSIWLLVDIAVEAHIPPLIGPVGVWVNVEDISRQSG